MEYKDFPKNNKNEFVSLINCSSQPPLISHGIGKDVESCHDMVSIFKNDRLHPSSLILFVYLTELCVRVCEREREREKRDNIAAKVLEMWEYLDALGSTRQSLLNENQQEQQTSGHQSVSYILAFNIASYKQKLKHV